MQAVTPAAMSRIAATFADIPKPDFKRKLVFRCCLARKLDRHRQKWNSPAGPGKNSTGPQPLGKQWHTGRA